MHNEREWGWDRMEMMKPKKFRRESMREEKMSKSIEEIANAGFYSVLLQMQMWMAMMIYHAWCVSIVKVCNVYLWCGATFTSIGWDHLKANIYKNDANLCTQQISELSGCYTAIVGMNAFFYFCFFLVLFSSSLVFMRNYFFSSSIRSSLCFHSFCNSCIAFVCAMRRAALLEFMHHKHTHTYSGVDIIDSL